MNDAVEALNGNVLVADAEAREVAAHLGRLRAALTRAHDRAEQLRFRGGASADTLMRVGLADEVIDRISTELTRLGKVLAPLTREAKTARQLAVA